MMRRFATRALLAMLLLCVPAWADVQQAAIPRFDSPVVDTTGTLDAASEQQLEQQALALQQRKGSQLQILVIPSTAPETIEQYAVRAFESFTLGRKGVDDGVLMVVAKDERKVRIEVGYGLEGAIPDIAAGRVIQEYMVPKFRQGDYAGGIVDASAQLVRLVDGEPLPEPVADHPTSADRGGNWLFALVAAFFVASFLRNIFGGFTPGVRALLCGGGAGLAAMLLSSVMLVGGFGAVIGLIVGIASVGGGGRYARHRDWGGFGGGWSGGSSGGGWSGGGGSSGGGGASGSW